MVLLNGRLEVLVIEARGLPNLDKGLFSSDNLSDPYCIVNAEGLNGSKRIGKTFKIDDCLNPKWNYKMDCTLNQDVGALEFIVKDKDKIGSEVIGKCLLDVISFTSSGKAYKGYLHLTSQTGRPAGSIRVQIKFSGEGGIVEEKESVIRKFRQTSIKDKIGGSSNHGKNYQDYASGERLFLHGTLDLYLIKAENLLNTDTSILSTFKKKDVSDPFVNVYLIDASKDDWKVATSSVIDNDLNPVWKERFQINICHDVIAVKLELKDKDILSADVLGTISFRSEDIIRGIDGVFDLKTKGKKRSTITLQINFIPTSDVMSHEVPNCVFPMREMNNVYLYQDAHCVNLFSPTSNHVIQPNSCRRTWLDLYNTIIGAREFIYIV